MSGTVTIVVECENSACQHARQPVEVALRAWGHVVEWPSLRCVGCEFVLRMPPVTPLAEAPHMGPEAQRLNRLTDDHIADVARIYKDAERWGRAPTRAVATHFGRPHSTAAKWVTHARRRGLLPEVTGR